MKHKRRNTPKGMEPLKIKPPRREATGQSLSFIKPTSMSKDELIAEVVYLRAAYDRSMGIAQYHTELLSSMFEDWSSKHKESGPGSWGVFVKNAIERGMI